MAVALQRPLFQDERSGVMDPRRIRSILQEIVDRMVRVQVSVQGDPVLYAAYLDIVTSNFQNDTLRIECGGWKRTPNKVACGSSLTLSFMLQENAYCFDTKIIEVREGAVRAALPGTLLYYPPRNVPRVRYPLQRPITVEFLNPRVHHERIVRELEDMSYDGLSFRVYTPDLPPPSGTVIPVIDLCSFDQCYYSTAAKVTHVTPCCDNNGKQLYRVGVSFLEKRESSSQDIPLLKENECEEIAESASIQRCLMETITSKAIVHVQDAEQKRPAVRALPQGLICIEEPLFSLQIRHNGPTLKRFATGQRIRIRYLMHGTLYLFNASICRATMDDIVIRVPACMHRVRRRRTLRTIKPVSRGVRLNFRTPLLDTIVDRPVLVLSEEGLSISMNFRRTLLFPGMRIKGATLNLNGTRYALPGIKIQSVMIIPSMRGRPSCRIGFLFEYLPESARQAILALLLQEHHPLLIRSTQRMVQDVWDLHYRSGFIYPDKHASIVKMQNEIDRTWEKLYSPETNFFLNLAFIHEENILGSGSILQAYDETWLLQHLSALKHPFAKASKEVNLGLAEELMRDKRIHYIKTYFRPENPWPNKNFRSFAEKNLKPQDFDLTLFRIYWRDPRPIPVQGGLPDEIEIGRMNNGEQEVIKNYFIRRGKILYARSESLLSSHADLTETSKVYRQRGLRRERKIFVARRGTEVICFVLAEDASFGVNLSGLLNHFRLFIVHQEERVVQKILPFLLNQVVSYYRVLGYPKVTLMTTGDENTLLKKWGFRPMRDYYCLTFQRKSILQYLHYIREKYGKLECRILRRIK